MSEQNCSFDEFFARHYTEVHSIVSRLRRKHERPNHTLGTTDIVDSVYLRIKESPTADTLPAGGISRLRAAIHRNYKQLMVNYAAHRNAAKGPGQHVHEPTHGIDWDRFEGVTAVSDPDLVRCLERVVLRTERDRSCVEAFLLHHYYQFTTAQTAHQIGVSVATTKRRISDASEAIRVELSAEP